MNILDGYESLSLDIENFKTFTHIQIDDPSIYIHGDIYEIHDSVKNYQVCFFYFTDKMGGTHNWSWRGGCFIPLIINEQPKTVLDKELRDIRTIGYRYK